ncbi:MAG: hypothetical protein K940chlam3_01348 [Chlamydiae bacterium]|nr:hypothetical protein [Chlamydiota bacterium]
MNSLDLKNQIAKLESLNDQLNTELSYVDKLLKQLGFDEGLISLKTAALEVLENPQSDVATYN